MNAYTNIQKKYFGTKKNKNPNKCFSELAKPNRIKIEKTTQVLGLRPIKNILNWTQLEKLR